MKFKQIMIAVGLLVMLNVGVKGGSWASGTVKNSSGALGYKVWTSSGYRKEKPGSTHLDASWLYAERGRVSRYFCD